jgi:hypothetical protein
VRSEEGGERRGERRGNNSTIIQYCYRYAHEKGCPWQTEKSLGARRFWLMKNYKLLVTVVGVSSNALEECGNAAHGGHLECLRYCSTI